jgi:antitoxin HigA-1
MGAGALPRLPLRGRAQDADTQGNELADRPPTPAGETLIEEFLRPGLTQREAAQRMGVPLNRLNELIRGKRGVTADTALRLADLFGTSPQFWMNLQVATDLYMAARPREQQRGLAS